MSFRGLWGRVASMSNDPYLAIAPDVVLGRAALSKFLKLYGCSVGRETKIGAFVEIQKNASVEMLEAASQSYRQRGALV